MEKIQEESVCIELWINTGARSCCGWLPGAAGLFLLAWGVIPLYTSRFHIGCLVLMLAGLLLLGAALLYPALAGESAVCGNGGPAASRLAV